MLVEERYDSLKPVRALIPGQRIDVKGVVGLGPERDRW